MKQKLLLFDVDGTLMGYDAVVPQSCIDAVAQARKNGHLAYVVTGRTRMRAIPDGMEMDGVIGGNGAYVSSHGEVIQDLSLPVEKTLEITQYLEQHDLSYFLEGNDGMYGSKEYLEIALPTYRKYGYPGDDLREIYPTMTFPENKAIGGIIKVNYILHTYEDYLSFKARFSSLQCLTWGGLGEDALFGDCALPGIDKQNAIEKLIDHLGFAKEDIIAFGDANVDIPMFEIAGESVCMENGGEQAKKAASFITKDVHEDGIAYALKHFGLI